MTRSQLLQRVLAPPSEPWDILVIGGGATGVGIALDAASRGYRTVLFERHDFGKGTSSRSTKLVHGGVRYLEQGNLSLVREALRERGILRRNAPHLVHDRTFIVPAYRWWEGPFYGIGLKLYQGLAGRESFGPSRWLGRDATLRRVPNLQPEHLRGGVVYHDGQFDDARLLIHLVLTALEQGATLVNYAPITGLVRSREGRVCGVTGRDLESGAEFAAAARVVINAAGPFADQVHRMEDPGAPPRLVLSQGSHLVVNGSFLPGETAILVPHTPDGRVMFAIPWNGHTLIGTTDSALDEAAEEPVVREEEIDFMLDTAGRYLARRPSRSDVLSVFVGIRPLARSGDGGSTAAISREHAIHVSASGLVTITGGKWTTYRSMAEECVDVAASKAGLPRHPSATRNLPIHGHDSEAGRHGDLAVYGADAARLQALIAEQPVLGDRLHPALPIRGAEVVWAAREELARTVEDVLARRTRALLLNATAAREMAPITARLLARELGRDEAWQAGQVTGFQEMARRYLPTTV